MKKLFTILLCLISFQLFSQGLPIANDFVKLSLNNYCGDYTCTAEVSLMYYVVQPNGPAYWASTSYVTMSTGDSHTFAFTYNGYGSVLAKKWRIRKGTHIYNLPFTDYSYPATECIPAYISYTECGVEGTMLWLYRTSKRNFYGSFEDLIY